MPSRVPSYKPPSLGSKPTDRHREYNRFGRDDVLTGIYNTNRWKRFRRQIRTGRVLCEQCSTKERPVIGVHVHHLKSPREFPELTFEPSNVLLWCHSCHSSHHAKSQSNVDK